MPRPQKGDYANFYQTYIDKTTSTDIQSLVKENSQTILNFLLDLPENKADFRYAPGKWTLKQVLQHELDTERIMVYRVLTFARNDKTALPGFDENEYATNTTLEHRTLHSLIEEFTALRNSTDYFLLSLSEQQINRSGIANGLPITVNALAYIIYGHTLHHHQVIQERYL